MKYFSILSFAVGFFVPLSVNDNLEQSTEVLKIPRGPYTEQEMENAQRQTAESLRKFEERYSRLTAKEKYLFSRQAGQWVSWIPWMFVGLIVSIDVMNIIIIILPIILFVVALLLGACMQRFIKLRRIKK
jgi:Flp pilus assembly protein TadB